MQERLPRAIALDRRRDEPNAPDREEREQERASAGCDAVHGLDRKEPLAEPRRDTPRRGRVDGDARLVGDGRRARHRLEGSLGLCPGVPSILREHDAAVVAEQVLVLLLHAAPRALQRWDLRGLGARACHGADAAAGASVSLSALGGAFCPRNPRPRPATSNACSRTAVRARRGCARRSRNRPSGTAASRTAFFRPPPGTARPPTGPTSRPTPS